ASQDLMPLLESGQLRVLAVGTEERLSYLDAPTFVEHGYPEITQSTTTFGVVAPAGTPQPVIAKLEETMRAASADPETRRGLDERYVPEQFLGSADLAALFAETEQTFQGVASGGRGAGEQRHSGQGRSERHGRQRRPGAGVRAAGAG